MVDKPHELVVEGPIALAAIAYLATLVRDLVHRKKSNGNGNGYATAQAVANMATEIRAHERREEATLQGLMTMEQAQAVALARIEEHARRTTEMLVHISGRIDVLNDKLASIPRAA